ncbi:TIGR02678 family protein [Rhodococcus sp. NPDC058521]|uniref:TIGR02678 family protein n=1 Tax=Rhodococcus sp. NPDC058521 TaxID=3346536 RepID=UPI003653870E
MRAEEIPSLTLDSYQRAARLVLTNHLITRSYPDRLALPLIRRWATDLRDDLHELFGYRLDVTETTARLFTPTDRLDPESPAKTASDRTFDRSRYAYLALSLAALGRSGSQITLSELADHVAASAAQIDGVELSTERASDRDAFVDAVGWLAMRGAIALTDGDASGWAADPESGEALYDIDRGVVVALFRPPRALQHLRSVQGLLAERSGDTVEVGRRVRRMLASRPVVYAAGLDDEERLQLAIPRTTKEVELLTGLVAERRAEGVAMIDTSARMSDLRFPGTGTVSQVALLLAGEIADRVLDPDAPVPEHLPLPEQFGSTLVEELDRAIPESGIADELVDDTDSAGSDTNPRDPDESPHEFPLIEDAWVDTTLQSLVERYGRTFAAAWQADPVGLGRAALALLERLDLVVPVTGGYLILPALARYRGVVATIRERTPEIDLFPSTSEDTTA